MLLQVIYPAESNYAVVTIENDLNQNINTSIYVSEMVSSSFGDRKHYFRLIIIDLQITFVKFKNNDNFVFRKSNIC